MATTVTGENKSAEDIVTIASEIWSRVRVSEIDRGDNGAIDSLLKELSADYRDFASMFPLVMRIMVQMADYDPKVFHRYIKLHVKPSYENREEFLRVKAEYAVMLFRKKDKNTAHARRYREKVIKSLEKDDRVFKEANDEAETAVEQSDQSTAGQRRRQLVAFCRAQDVLSASLPAAGDSDRPFGYALRAVQVEEDATG